MATPDWLMRYRKRRKEAAVALLGGRCVRCGSTEELQFDHVKREGKLGNIATMIRMSSWESILAELTKCQLLCERCHAKKNGDETRLNTHGRTRMYLDGCRCDACRERYREQNRKHKATYLAKRRVLSFQGEAPGS